MKHWEFIFITSFGSKQKLNVTPGLEHRNELRRAERTWHFFQSWQSTQAQREGLLFYDFCSLATQVVHFIYISTTHWFENLPATARQKLLAQMKRRRVHPLSASVRTKTSGRCMVVRSLQNWCTAKDLLTNKQNFNHFRTWYFGRLSWI